MSQTTTHVNACDASIWLDNAAGAPVDISGSSNRVELRFSQQVDALKQLEAESYPLRRGYWKDCEIVLRVVYSTADNEAVDLLNDWYHEDEWLLLPRSLNVYVPDDGAGSDRYYGEAVLESLRFTADPAEPGPTAMEARLLSDQEWAYAVIMGDWWDPNTEGLCIWAAYEPKGAASFAASLVDQSGNGNHASDPGGANTPTWDAVNGWKFDGGDDYLTTTFLPAIDQSQSIIVQYTTVTDTGYLFGTRESTFSLYICPNFGSASVAYQHGFPGRVVSPQLLSGNLAIAGDRPYRNGVDEGGAALGGYPGTPTLVVWIGAANHAIDNFPIAAYIQAFAIYDCTLTAAQVLAVATAMAAL